MNNKNKYYYVESKVKQYRLNIQNQDREHKIQMELEKIQTNKLLNIEQNVEETQIDDNEKQLIEKQKVIDVLNKQLQEQIMLNSSYQVKIDSMRHEISHLKSLTENRSSTNSGTPTSVRNTHHFDIFKTPIRTISRTLLSPFRTNTPKNADNTVESESDVDNNALESSNDSSTVIEIDLKTHKTFTVDNQEVNKLSFNSTHELMNSENKKKSKLATMVDFLFSCTTCKHCKQTQTISINKQYLKDNKIYPTVEDNYKGNCDIPMIFITSPLM